MTRGIGGIGGMGAKEPKQQAEGWRNQRVVVRAVARTGDTSGHLPSTPVRAVARTGHPRPGLLRQRGWRKAVALKMLSTVLR